VSEHEHGNGAPAAEHRAHGINPGDELAELLRGQRDAVELERFVLNRLLFAEPDASRLTFGGGQPARQELAGNQEDPFAGVYVENPNPITVYLGFEAGGADMRGYTVAPYSWKCLPRRFQNLSFGVSSDDAAGGAYNIMVTRLWLPPLAPGAGPLGSPAEAGTALADGRKVVAAAGTREALVPAPTPARYVTLTALRGNAGDVVVGGNTVVAALAGRRGVPLAAGDSETLPVNDLAKVFLDAEVNGDGVSFVYVT
jgi:hypothetical protein